MRERMIAELYLKGWRASLKVWVFKKLGIKYGPFMIPVRDYWLFVDEYQRIWKIRYTGDFNYSNCPLIIEPLGRMNERIEKTEGE